MIRLRPSRAVDLAASPGAQGGAFPSDDPRIAARVRSLEMTLSAINDFAYVFDLEGRFLYANRALLDLWGMKLEDAVGKTFFELPYPEELAVKLQGQIQEVVATKRRLVDEAWYTNPRGVGGCYEYIFTPVLDADGAVEFVAGSTRDITDRRLAEDLLREAEQRATHMLESITDGFMTLDREWRITYLNSKGAEMLALLQKTRSGLLKKVFWEEFPDTLGTVFESSYRRAMRDHAAVNFEAFYEPLEMWVQVRVYPSAEGLSLYFLDVTERRKLEAEREHLLEAERVARAEAERASHVKDEFLATLGHELRTPLNAILGWTYLLKGAHEPEELADGLETIERNARAQTRLIEDLLDMSSIISGKVRLELAEVNLASIVLAAMGATKHAADEKEVIMEAVIDPLKVAVSGDANRLQQVFSNLLTNAIKFTPAGGRVKVVLERLDKRMEVSVSDTGEGIPPGFLPHVFDRFRQADASTTRRHGGLGLGLSIVKQLVELHGGWVGVRSPGRGLGATFYVSLPLIAVAPLPPNGAALPAPNAAASAGPHSADVSPIRGVRVLVVDDEEDARTMIARVLEGCEAAVTAAASAAEALACLQTGDFDVLVSDIGMAGEDGYSLVRQVRTLASAQGGAIPAIALTAYARLEDREKAIDAGFQRHMVKPVEPGELIAMIAALARR